VGATDDGPRGSVKASSTLLSRGARVGWISLKGGSGWLQCGDGGWVTGEKVGVGRFCGSLSPPSASSSPLGPRCLNHFIFLSSPHSLLYKFPDYRRPLMLGLHYFVPQISVIKSSEPRRLPYVSPSDYFHKQH